MSISINRPVYREQRRVMELNETLYNDQSAVRIVNKTINKLPSVSFCYKSSGLYSPQNIENSRN